MDWLKEIGKWELSALMFGAGFIVLLVALLDGLPSEANGWTFQLREQVNWGTVLLGVVLLLFSIGALALRLRWSSSVVPQHATTTGVEPSTPASPPVQQEPPPVVGSSAQALPSVQQVPTIPIERESDMPVREPEHNQHPLVSKWWRLPKTQKELVVFFYEHSHRPQIELDVFYKAFTDRNGPELVGNVDEMHYRLKDLETGGFLHLEAVASRATNVCKIGDVAAALRDGDIIST